MLGALTLLGSGDAELFKNGAWIIFIVGLIGTFAYAITKYWDEGAYGVALKSVVTTFTFFAWSFSMGGYTQYVSGYNQLYATILVGATTLFAPVIYKAYDLATKPPYTQNP
jgi:ABC-type thiamin/hydroxymethylpyrimidine transport system permease subunit